MVVFDTTYRKNRYNLICGLIVGINNHWCTIIFGCTFIADEKLESVECILEQFRKVMNNKSLVSIVTNKNFAITKE